MKIAVTYRPKTPPPADAMPELFQGVGEWIKNYGDRFEVLYFFAGGGGFGVADIDDSAEVQRMMAEHPFTMYSDVETRAVVDAETALKQLQEVFG
jgi:hypothetical protein